MLLTSLDLDLHSSTRLTPLTQICSRLLVASLVHQLFVLVVEPYLFQLLFLQIISWVVSKVVRAALKLINGRELHILLFRACVKRFKWWTVGCALRHSEGAASIGEMLRRCLSGGSHGTLVVYNWNIVYRTKLCCHKAMITFLFPEKCQLSILSFYLIYCISIFLSELFVLVGMDADSGWLNVVMSRSLRFCIVINFICFLGIGVVHRSLPGVHGLVVGFDCVLVTKGRVNFLLNNSAHGVRQLVRHRIQKSKLRLNLLLGECAHSNQLLEKPLVGLAELPKLDSHVAFVDDVDNQLAETPVKIDTVLLTEARFAHDFLLHICKAAINPDLLRIEVEGTKTGYQFFIH